MLKTSGSGRHGRPGKTYKRPIAWHRATIAALLAGAAAGLSLYYYPGKPAVPRNSAYTSVPSPIVTATATGGTPAPVPTRTLIARPAPTPTAPAATGSPTPTPTPTPTQTPTPPPPPVPLTPLAGANYAGSLVLNDTGSALASWNQTSTFCPEEFWEVPDGTVSTNASGDATLTVTGDSGSCVAAISPGAYSSAVIEADIDFPALPGSSNTIADWTSFWLTDGDAWPEDGELDAVEAQPVNGVNAVSWHSGSDSSQFVASTDDFFPAKLPQNAPNLTPGWHVVDIVYTQGFFAVYYDGQQYTSYTSDNVTGDPLNIYITTSVTPDISSIAQELGGPPVNSDSSPATISVKYLRVWSYQAAPSGPQPG
jgi:hypothetical protein